MGHKKIGQEVVFKNEKYTVVAEGGYLYHLLSSDGSVAWVPKHEVESKQDLIGKFYGTP